VAETYFDAVLRALLDRGAAFAFEEFDDGDTHRVSITVPGDGRTSLVRPSALPRPTAVPVLKPLCVACGIELAEKGDNLCAGCTAKLEAGRAPAVIAAEIQADDMPEQAATRVDHIEAHDGQVISPQS
jgi:hypothetical protein